jgi:hypothetical protein
MISNTGDPRQRATMALAYTFGISVAVLELCCYVAFFHHIYVHNNTVAVNIVTPAVIKNRNRVRLVLAVLF